MVDTFYCVAFLNELFSLTNLIITPVHVRCIRTTDCLPFSPCSLKHLLCCERDVAHGWLHGAGRHMLLQTEITLQLHEYFKAPSDMS